jgi:SAM-dependent methyltransferase
LGLKSLEHTRRAFERLVRELGIRFSSAADVGCGTGLFARHLSRAWRVPVIAVDRSPAMLRIAGRNCCDTGVSLLQQDLRSLRLPNPVDLITANFDTVNHLITREDLGQALRCIADNLQPGGHFIFDFLTHCQPLTSARPYLRRLRGARGEVQQWIRWDPARRSLSIRIVSLMPALAPPAVEEHRERAFTPEEMGQALIGAGLIVRGVYNAVTLRPAATCAPRLIVVAQKSTYGEGLPSHNL